MTNKTRWTTVKSTCHIQFEPSPNSHLGLANAVSSLSESYPQAQQGQVPARVPVQTEQGVVMQQGQTPQWILRPKDGAHVAAITPMSLTIEELQKDTGQSVLLSDTKGLWSVCTNFLEPKQVGQIGVRTTVIFEQGVPLETVLESNHYIPNCLLEGATSGSARVEKALPDNYRLVLGIGQNNQGFPIVDVDVFHRQSVGSDWPTVKGELSEVYKYTATVLGECLKDADVASLIK